MIRLEKKEPSKKRKFKNFVAKCWLLDPSACGYKVWKNLDNQLPEAVGSTCGDESRIQKFQEFIKTLSFVEYYALKEYLREKYNWWDEVSYGHHTGSEEQLCTKKMQIYSSHFNVME